MTQTTVDPAKAGSPQPLLKDRYSLHEEIGRGGMAIVYRATDTTLAREVAVKVLHEQLSREPEFVDQFLRLETRIARLYHPHLVTIFDAGVENNACFVVMEYVAGGSLRHRLAREGALAVGEAVRLVAQAADALSQLHNAGIIHGDIKPDNLLLDEDGNVKLADFGIAHIATTTGVLDPQQLGGSAPYLAPEQVNVGDTDHRADIYALGLVAYELLAGRRAFDGDNWIAVAAQRLERDPDPLRPIRPDLPKSVERAVLRSLTRDPDRRFGSAEAFRQALLSNDDMPAQEASTSFGERIRPHRVLGSEPAECATEVPRALPQHDYRDPETVANVAERSASARTTPRRSENAGRPGGARGKSWRAPRRLVLLGIAGALLIALLVLLTFARLVNPPHPVRVPPLIGQTVQVARSTARQAGFEVSAAEEPSESVSRETVMRQEPAADTMAQSDQPVRLVVSSGPPPVRVPDLTGRRIDDATKDLVAVGLTLGAVSQREVATGTVPIGTIIEQAVRPGLALARGATVDVVVGVLPMTTTPPLIDKSVGDAEVELDKRGLQLGVIHMQPVSGKRAGTVLAQDPVPDVKLRKGERVAITIAVPASSLQP